MWRLVLLLACVFSLSAQEHALAVTENDPSTLVEGVSVITGDLYTYDEDYVVQGARPIVVRRSYVSREGRFKDLNNLAATFFTMLPMFAVYEPNGSLVSYFEDPQNKKKKHHFRFNALTQNDKGLANTSKGAISAHTNLKNQYLILDGPIGKINKEGGGFTLYASDGTQRRYANLPHQKPIDTPCGKKYLEYFFILVSETFPDGHVLQYRWNKKNQLERLCATNLRQTKTFASLDVGQSSHPVTHAGSDGRSITYQAAATGLEHILSPDFPKLHFDWELKKQWIEGFSKTVSYLKTMTLPCKRTLEIGYGDIEDPAVRKSRTKSRIEEIDEKISELKRKGKKKHKKKIKQYKGEKNQIVNLGLPERFSVEFFVKTLSAPVGDGDSLITTHTFCFDKPNKNSFVLDAHNNKTAYFWNDDFRLTEIIRYQGTSQVLSGEKFLWEGERIQCKTFLDQNLHPLSTRTYRYDGFGNVVEETFSGNGVEPHVKKASYTQDDRHLLLTQEEAEGLLVRYSYRDDAQLIVSKTICERGQERIVYAYDYDEDLLLVSESVKDEVSHLAKKITLKKQAPYLGMPEVIEEFYNQNTLLKKTVLHYGTGATVVSKDIFDAKGKFCYSLYMTYDDKGRLKTETNALGQTAHYAYDEVGNRIYAKDFSGRLETFFTYDASNRLRKKEEKGDDGAFRCFLYKYDTKNNLIEETDPYGNVTNYAYDALQNRTKISLPSIAEARSDTLFQYDSFGNAVRKEEPEGWVTCTEYNAYNKPTKTTHPDGAVETFTYDCRDNLKTSIDAKNVKTSFEYDYLNRMIRKTVAGAVEVFEYKGQYLVKKIDPEGYATLYTYDGAGRKMSEERAGEKAVYAYDSLGRLHTVQKGDLITVTEYDLLDRVIEERSESAVHEVLKKVCHAYDPLGKTKTTTRFINGRQEREVFEYDSLGRLIKKTDALGFFETIAYDPKIHRTTRTDANGLATIETYNAQNKIASVEKRKNGKTQSLQQKSYTPNGNLQLQVDTAYVLGVPSREVRTRWEYNNRNLVKTLVEADGAVDAKITRYAYDLNTKLQNVVKPDGTVLTYRYNDLGYLESLSSSDGTVNHRMAYNLLGHIQSTDNITRTTDPFGRILTETFSSGLAIKNAYDGRGRKTTCAIADADCLIRYEYDSLHVRKVARSRLNGSVLYSHAYTAYDLSSNLLEQELILNQGRVQFSVDPLSRTSAIAAPQFSHKVLQYDPVGNILQMSIGADLIAYTYDDLYQLTSETGHRYLFDSLNNRLAKDGENYEVNALNQVISHVEYDKNGNPKYYNGARYAYDALDRLIRLETSQNVQCFTYDYFNRCVSKTATETIYFLYDGQNEIGAFDERKTPLELRILGNVSHAEIGAAVAVELQGQVYVPIHDLQGNLAALLAPGKEPTYYRYSAFGEEKIDGFLVSPWRFFSKRVDGDLVNFGRRYYIPSLGRWLTPDPAGFTDGVNLYAYLHNNPLIHFDEYGLFGEGAFDRWRAGSQRYWNTFSSYSRNFLAYQTHDIYHNYVAPIQKEINDWRRFVPQFDKPWKEFDVNAGHSAIDRFFGTTFSNSWWDRSNPFVSLEMPSPGGLLNTAGRVSSLSSKLFCPKALSPSIKLASNAQKYARRTVGEFEEVARQYTKSNLRMGQQVHKSYKAAIADMIDRHKEFRLPSGRKIDFLDIKNYKVYELKPNNPRAIKDGMKQLNTYIEELKQMPEFKNKNWEGVLEVY